MTLKKRGTSIIVDKNKIYESQERRRNLAEKNAAPMEMNLFESMYGFMQFSKNPDFDGLRKIMKYSPHMHGKFIDILDDGTEATIPYDKILKVLDEENYDGLDLMSFHFEIPGAEAKKILERYGIVLSAVNLIMPFANASAEEKFTVMLSRAKAAIDQACEAYF